MNIREKPAFVIQYKYDDFANRKSSIGMIMSQYHQAATQAAVGNFTASYIFYLGLVVPLIFKPRRLEDRIEEFITTRMGQTINRTDGDLKFLQKLLPRQLTPGEKKFFINNQMTFDELFEPSTRITVVNGSRAILQNQTDVIQGLVNRVDQVDQLLTAEIKRFDDISDTSVIFYISMWRRQLRFRMFLLELLSAYYGYLMRYYDDPNHQGYPRLMNVRIFGVWNGQPDINKIENKKTGIYSDAFSKVARNWILEVKIYEYVMLLWVVRGYDVYNNKRQQQQQDLHNQQLLQEIRNRDAQDQDLGTLAAAQHKRIDDLPKDADYYINQTWYHREFEAEVTSDTRGITVRDQRKLSLMLMDAF